MASDPAKLDPADPPAASRAAPLGGTRSQAMQRLQVGVFGLAAMILLVGLASIINTSRAKDEAAASASDPGVADPVAAVADPLADAGVVPDMPAAASPTAAPGLDARPASRP
jgi:hypothetical protein